LFLVLLATPAVYAACNQCVFSDASGTVQSGCTAKGDLHLLSCSGSAQIEVDQAGLLRAFDKVVCLDGGWYGTTCKGQAAFLDASVAVSCPPPPCTVSCPFTLAAGGEEPIEECVEGVQVKSCADGKLQIEASEPTEFDKAVCMADGSWMGMNCEGSLAKLGSTLTAACSSEPATTPAVATTSPAAPPTTTAANGGLGALLVQQNSNAACQVSTACDYQMYESELSKKVNTPETCFSTSETNWWSSVACLSNAVTLEGYDLPAGSILIQCIVKSSGTKWVAANTAGVVTEISPVGLPIVRCVAPTSSG
ncbi:hypothetical protein PFISCL1PPCAC_4814, partial [Pristionchus fissidentatus]